MASPRAGSAGESTSWREVRPSAVVLLSGPEEYLASKAAESIRHQVRAVHPEAELVSIDAGSYEAGALALQTSPSLFGDWKIVEATGLAQMNDDFLVDSLAYLADPAPDVVLVLGHSGGNRGRKLLDTVKAMKATIVDCQPLKKDAERADFVSTEFRTAHRRIAPDAVRALVAAVGSKLPELAAACQQLMADTGGEVTVELVEKYYGGRIEATGFKVADAALAGRTAQALSMLRHALATGADPVPIVAALALKVRAVAKVHGARGSSGQLARELGMAPWQVDQARKEARRFSSAALARCIRALAEADAQVKGEARDPVYAVERAVTVIALAED
ncbi:DNA polymerase III subunit delta [Arthrobacter echini]|uniref:DNA-directed DNA polymerase n=1 Tax=Arthrobacter echini TaxID=1529066 RepID=A0A4S5E6B8_9MICC|nr:DNA polymerase III subunit delta [Arthrobacter echini]THJ67087.1 DNA polymerase III subunit delta [Arthrobacter echini]